MKLIFPNIFLLVCLLFIFDSCKQTSNNGTTDVQEIEDQLKKDKVLFTVRVNNLRLRKEAGTDGEVISTLEQGAKLIDLGMTSDFVTEIQLQGKTYLEPWIKVRTTDGIEAWVYAGALVKDVATSKILLEKKVQVLFGNDIKKNIDDYNTKINKLQTSKDFEIAFNVGELLRDTLVEIIGEKFSPNAKGQLPDLFWLEDLMPAYESALIMEASRYFLFQNYKEFYKIAANTKGKEDDLFIEFCTFMHDADSIEYFFPSWTMQVSDIEGYSLLGAGKHYTAFEKLNEMRSKNSFFAKQLDLIKQDLVDDVTRKGISYWEPKEKIIKELNRILKKKFKILNQNDRVALQTRLKQFANPKANGIELNLRSGMEE